MTRFTWWLLALAVLASACATLSRHAAPAGRASCCTAHAESPAAFTDKSLYQIDSTWTNDLGHSFKLGDLRGRVQILAMYFASCAYACPAMVHDMERIEAALPEAVRAQTGFTLVTIDPERDTPGALRAYRASHRLAAARWALLRGTSDDTLELAALLGVKYKKEASGQFAHSILITVLNEQGEIIHQLAGLNQDIQETVRRIETAVAGAGLTPPRTAVESHP
jgi:protein SCO1/2